MTPARSPQTSRALSERLDLLPNLRDLGGLQAADGRTVRYGTLFRSATPMFLDAKQSELLVDGLGLQTRIDLRRSAEIADGTSPALASRERRVVHTPVRAASSLTADPTDPAQTLARRYRSYLATSGETIVDAVSALAEPGSLPALVHCSAGKDRTGVVVALVLSAVGVEPTAIVDDYARTREHLQTVFRLLRGVDSYSERLSAIPEEAITAEPRTMQAFLELLETDHGGAREYLLRSGLPQSVLGTLQAAVLTDE